jgi:anti-sigma factor RsiW
MQLSISPPNFNLSGVSASSKDELKTMLENGVNVAVSNQPGLKVLAGAIIAAGASAIDAVTMPVLPEPTTMNPNPSGLSKLAITASGSLSASYDADGAVSAVTSASLSVNVTQTA